MWAIAGVVAVVQSVLAVPGLAQSNSAYNIARSDLLSSVAMREYVANADVSPTPGVLPPNLIAAPAYRVLLESMLARSATFRRQCRRVAGTPGLLVTLRPGVGPSSGARARTQLGRVDGQLVAAIELLTLRDPVELIAHEIEHVIEQLDGVDLASKADVAASGVQSARTEDRAFETTRAKRIGLKVAGEVLRFGR